MTRTIAIRLKAPRAKIPGCHGEKILMFGIGSIRLLDQDTQPLTFFLSSPPAWSVDRGRGEAEVALCSQ